MNIGLLHILKLHLKEPISNEESDINKIVLFPISYSISSKNDKIVIFVFDL